MAKMTDTEKLNLLIRDDPEISGKMYARMKMHINEATVVDAVEVVHGRWDVEVGMNYNKERICPVCNKHIESNYWNYCPNCGAKMDGDGNG